MGTGEANSRNSLAWGDGIYKSTDGGLTFQNIGVKDTFQIARVVTHPTSPDIVYVAAIGNLWAYTGDRGVFKTIDGGKTWQKLTAGLPTDAKTGATDLLMDPSTFPRRVDSRQARHQPVRVGGRRTPRGGGGAGGGGGSAGRLAPGSYTIKLIVGADTATGTLTVREDPILKK